MLRDSCLYSSLACSVYSIRCFFFSFLVLNNMQIFIHHLTQTTTHTLWSVLLKNMFVHFWIRNGEMTNLWENLWIKGNVQSIAALCSGKPPQTGLAQSGRLSGSLHSSTMLMLLWPLQGLDIWQSLQFLLLSSQMESGPAWKHLFLLYISDSDLCFDWQIKCYNFY